MLTDQEAWLNANTFYCPYLRARLTPAQCHANRQLPRMGETQLHYRPGHHPGFMPAVCEKCSDYKTLRGPMEDSMSKPERGICEKCGKERSIAARGLCHSCYKAQRRKANKVNETCKTETLTSPVVHVDFTSVPGLVDRIKSASERGGGMGDVNSQIIHDLIVVDCIREGLFDAGDMY